MRHKNRNYNSGFTLIELLVVISIIGMIASSVLVSLNSARSKARDARRKGDIRQMQTMLELYNDKYNAYPLSTSGCRGDGWCVDDANQNGTSPNPNWIPGLNEFGQLPHNPLPYGSPGWTYHYTSDGRNYWLMAYLENIKDKDACGGGAILRTYWGMDACAWGPGIYGRGF